MANPRGMLYVLNTHVLIWYFIGSRRLRGELRERIDETRRQGGRLLVPTIVLAPGDFGLMGIALLAMSALETFS